ncbi:hypothetical protein [Metasolibacillus sp. FSL K6-0083]|uniref:hypothetical protein n=1 Tax=Metasolibacillus sp. FSL K6-0083 TaxID=2921416 RepID=UPI00315B2C02
MRQKPTGTSGVLKADLNRSSIPASGTFDLSTILDITNEAGNPITSEYEFDSYTVGTNSTQASKLVIKPTASGTMDKTITIKMKDMPAAYDYAGQNAFDLEDFGQYMYPPAAHRLNTMSYAQLAGDIRGNAAEWNSVDMEISVNIGAAQAMEQEYYYAVVAGNAPEPTVDDILTTVRNNSPVIGSPIISFGTGKIKQAADTSVILERKANGSEDADTRNVFKTGQKVYLFTKDKYGNIIWAIEKRDPIDLNAPRYVIITR